MDIDDIKTLWLEISKKVENQKELTDEIILRMAHTTSKNRLNRILIFELFGITWLLFFISFVLLKLDQLDTIPLLLSAILSIVICITSILLSVNFIRKAFALNIAHKSYKDTLLDFAVLEKTYHFNKKLYLPLGLALLVCIYPMVAKWTHNADVFSDTSLTTLSLYVCGGGVVYTILVWLHTKYYNKMQTEINGVLHDLKK
jgi:hypothetical protein